MRTDATIAAIATPAGPGLRGAIRISGPRAADLVRALVARGAPAPALGARASAWTRVDDGGGEQPCLVLWMPGPRSYTREDVAELHLLGSPPLLARALERVIELGARPAAPGEFTRRAFESGRIDLLQAEGVLALVESAGERERRAALALCEGELGARLAGLREGLEELRALAEASLDFDESETGHVPLAELEARAAAVADALDRALAWEVRRQPPRALPRVVLAGAPNAGKSTLFNALVPDGRALESDVAGSTRDGASGLWPLAGERGPEVLLGDAPGLDPAAGGADRAAQELAARERRAADLLLFLVDARDGVDAAPRPDDPPRLLVWSRADRAGARPAPAGALAVSARERRGLDALARAVARALALDADASAASDPAGEGALGLVRELSARHRLALREAREHLARARALLAAAAPLDLAAEALRQATDALDAIQGRTTPEDLLDRIFARFCLGK